MFETGSISFATAFVAGRDLLPVALRAAAGARLPLLCRRHLARRACATGRPRACVHSAMPPASCWASRLVFMAFGASATALGGLLLSWRYELGIVAGVDRAAVRAASGRPAADPPARARGALPRRDQGRPGRRRVPARPRLRLRLDALHRTGPGRDPDDERHPRPTSPPAPRCWRSIPWAWACHSCWRPCSPTCCSSACGSWGGPAGGCSASPACCWPWSGC